VNPYIQLSLVISNASHVLKIISFLSHIIALNTLCDVVYSMPTMFSVYISLPSCKVHKLYLLNRFRQNAATTCKPNTYYFSAL